MHRRTLFAHIGVATTIGGYTGCLGSSDNNQASTDQRTSENSTDDGQPVGDDSSTVEDNEQPVEDDEPHERYVLSESDEPDLPEGVDPHELRVTNAADELQEISIHIARDGSSVFDRTEEVPSNASLEFVLAEPGTYEITLEVDETRSTMGIDRSWDDCARSETIVTLSSDGIKTRTRTVQSNCA